MLFEPCSIHAALRSAHTRLPWCRYSQDGLTGVSSLKNRDRAVAAILHDLVRQGHLHAYLVILTRYEGGSGYNHDIDYSAVRELKAGHVLNLDGTKAHVSLWGDDGYGCYSDDHFDEDEILQVGLP